MTMDRRRAMLWLTLVGSVMFTSYTLWPSGNKAPASRPAAATGAPVAATAAAAAPPAAPPGTPPPPLPENEWARWRAQLKGTDRDPFFTVAEIAAMNRPPAVAHRVDAPPPAAAPEYVVKLVVMTGLNGKAMIGDQVVQVGDMLGDERVTEIHRDGVVLEKNGARRRLPLAAGGTTLAAIRLERNR